MCECQLLAPKIVQGSNIKYVNTFIFNCNLSEIINAKQKYKFKITVKTVSCMNFWIVFLVSNLFARSSYSLLSCSDPPRLCSIILISGGIVQICVIILSIHMNEEKIIVLKWFLIRNGRPHVNMIRAWQLFLSI